MIFYYSYWGYASKKGWRDFELTNSNLFSPFSFLEKSLLLLRLQYPKSQICFITDDIGIDLLKKNPQIKFDNVFNILEEIPKEYNETWSLGKLYAYRFAAQQKEQFIHIDNDVFISKPFPQDLVNRSLIVQSEDTDRRVPETPWVPYNYQLFSKEIKNFYLIKNHEDFNCTYNCGIFGGKDLDFIAEYSSSAINMVFDQENKSYFLTPNKDFYNGHGIYYADKACVAEQYYLAGACHFSDKHPSMLVPDYNAWEIEKNIDSILEEYGYVHLMGWLKEESNLYFKRCLAKTKSKVLWPPIKRSLA